MKRRALKPWHGILFFILVMAVFFLICVPMQMWWGMYGLAATELLILVMAVVFAKLMGYPLKVMFPIHKPGILPILGTVILWFSLYLLVMVESLIQYRLFPVQMYQVSSGLNDVIYSVPFILSVFIVSVMPAVCEEAVHRGVILHTLYTVRKEWLVVLIMAVYFGLFHSDLLRFLPTAILGGGISYVMLETENMIYPALFHCVNNLFPMLLQMILLGGARGQIMEQAGEIVNGTNGVMNIPIASIGVYLIFAACAPFGIYLGNYLLHHRSGVRRSFFPRDKRVKNILRIVIPTVILFWLGVAAVVGGFLYDPVLWDMIG